MHATAQEERVRFQRAQAEHFASAGEAKFVWQTRDPYLQVRLRQAGLGQ